MTTTTATDFITAAIHNVLVAIELQREEVDRGLTHPARWRGPLRRELAGRDGDDAARERYAQAFDWLAGSTAVLDEALLRDVHDRIAGGTEYRSGAIRIGGRTVAHPPASDVAGMIAQALVRAGDGVEPPALAAARLHLELGLIHPFADGNGRTARLLSSLVLMRAGHRSTLLTAVEQFGHADPAQYRAGFRRLRMAGDEQATWEWLARALGAMMLNSHLAAWHRMSRDSIAQRGAPAALDHPVRDELAWQLRRLRAEEREDAGPRP